jgi:hypothetical protein
MMSWYSKAQEKAGNMCRIAPRRSTVGVDGCRDISGLFFDYQVGLLRRLTIGVKRISVSVVDRVAGAEVHRGIVAVGVVESAGSVDVRGVGLLVQNGGGLVLAVAAVGQGGEVVEEQRAVCNVVVCREGVGEDVGSTPVVHVCAVCASWAAGGGLAICCDGGEAVGDGLAGVVVGRHEVLLKLAGVAGRGSVSGAGGELLAVVECCVDRFKLGAGAVALANGALCNLVDGLGVHLRLEGVDLEGQPVAVESESLAGQLGGVGLGVVDSSGSRDIIRTFDIHVVQLSQLNFDCECLAGVDCSE